MIKVCVQGLGFVGSAMAIAVADSKDEQLRPRYQVVGIDLPTTHGLARVEAVNAGRFPFVTTDNALNAACSRVHSVGNLRASTNPTEFEDCSIVVVDVHLDVDFDSTPPRARLEGFANAIRTLGRYLPSGALIIVETTVPPGTTENLVVPILAEEGQRRGMQESPFFIAHSYERVMPGKDYLSSIQNYWRVYSGCNERAANSCEKFLRTVINTIDYPLTRLSRPVESESAKLLENSFRAVNIALIDEWARFAERVGVNLLAVTDAIRIRPTHRNIMKPGFGVGGYCLTKDPLLAGIGAREFFQINDMSFPFCEAAVQVNGAMPLASLSLLQSMLGSIETKRILLLGASYRPDVADTRFSPSARFVVEALAENALVTVHDPLADHFDTIDYPIENELPDASQFDAIVFAVGHKIYLEEETLRWLESSSASILDANCILPQAWTEQLQKAGRTVRSIGRGCS